MSWAIKKLINNRISYVCKHVRPTAISSNYSPLQHFEEHFRSHMYGMPLEKKSHLNVSWQMEKNATPMCVPNDTEWKTGGSLLRFQANQMPLLLFFLQSKPLTWKRGTQCTVYAIDFCGFVYIYLPLGK